MRRLGRVAAGLAALVVVLAGGVWAVGLATLPARHQGLAIAGLSAPVEVRFDQDGVPRIRAATDLDAAAALGFVHARDRMFQMEVMRRAGSGRLAEMIGARGLPIDRFIRTLGLWPRAQADYPLLPAHTRALLEAYTRGVNGWIAARGRWAAPEFVALGAPAPWSPVDCLLWGKTMTLYLSGNYRDELDRLALGKTLPAGKIGELWPASPQPLPPQAAFAAPGLARLAAGLDGALPRFPAPFTLPATASNEWAVDGAHSATGAPLLAGDPHLSYGLPGLWYLARIDLPGHTLAGATSPGVPFLVIGRNAHIAWTFTTTGTDSEDLFIETPVDAGHYRTPDGVAAYATRDEVIHVRGGADQVLRVRQTRHGPVISDLYDATRGGPVLALAMAGLAAGDTAPAGLDALNQAADVRAAIAAAPLITSPNQNLLVADGRTIGQAVTGRVPIRAGGDGENAADGASGRFDWVGLASGAQLPQVIGPASGRLVNANERIAAADFPVFLGRDWYGAWRADRIRQMLDAHPRASVDDFAAMQMDDVSLFARQILPALRAAAPKTELGQRAQALLGGWDGQMARDAPQGLIFEGWVQRFAIDLLASGHVPAARAGPRLEFIAAVLGGPDGAWCGGDCGARLSTALDEEAADLAKRYGDDPAAWRWGPAHQAVFAHPVLGQIPFVRGLATRRIAAAGGEATVGRAGMAYGAAPSFDDVHGASYRGVYDLAALDRSRFIAAPGQSGNLFSRHLDDFILRWRDGKGILLGPEPSHIEATLTLTPPHTPP